MPCDTWLLTCDTWHVTCDIWHVTGGERWTFPQSFSSLALPVLKVFSKSMTESLSNKGVCTTAPAHCVTNTIFLDEWISKYICQKKYITNEYLNKFALEKNQQIFRQMNIFAQIYSNIFNYQNICPTLFGNIFNKFTIFGNFGPFWTILGHFGPADDKGLNGFQREGRGGKDRTWQSRGEGKNAYIKISLKLQQNCVNLKNYQSSFFSFLLRGVTRYLHRLDLLIAWLLYLQGMQMIFAR